MEQRIQNSEGKWFLTPINYLANFPPKCEGNYIPVKKFTSPTHTHNFLREMLKGMYNRDNVVCQ